MKEGGWEGLSGRRSQYSLDPAGCPGTVRPASTATRLLEVLLKGHAMDAAKQFGLEDRERSIEVCKTANFVVPDEDIVRRIRSALAPSCRPRSCSSVTS